MYRNNKNSLFALALLSFAFVGSSFSMDEDSVSDEQQYYSSQEDENNGTNQDAAANSNDEQNPQDNSSASDDEQGPQDIPNGNGNSDNNNGWFAFSWIKSNMPSPRNFVTNSINNIKDYTKKANVAAHEGLTTYLHNLRNYRETQVVTGATLVTAIGAGYVGYKYYNNNKEAKRLKELATLENEINNDAAQVQAENKDVNVSEEAKLEQNVNNQNQADNNDVDQVVDENASLKAVIAAEMEKVWRSLLEEFLKTITNSQFSNCPELDKVLEIGGLDNPTFFKDNVDVWGILNSEQQRKLNIVIAHYENALDILNDDNDAELA